MTILDTLPALPFEFISSPEGWEIYDKNGVEIVFSEGTEMTAAQAQALVSLVNSAGAMREALFLCETWLQMQGDKMSTVAAMKARAALALIEEKK